MIRAGSYFLPAFLFLAAAAAMVCLSLLQETALAKVVPFLNPETAYATCHAVFLAYLVLAWPFAVSFAARKLAKRPYGRILFLAIPFFPAVSLFALMLPLMSVAGAYSGRDAADTLWAAPAYLAFAAAVAALFRLKFYFDIRIMRIYIASAASVCAGLPALDFVLRNAFGKGIGPAAGMNPFHFLLIASSGEHGLPFDRMLLFAAAWAGVAAVLASLPLALGRVPQGFYDAMNFTQNGRENEA